MSVPIASPVVDETARERVNEVLESGQLADGPEVRAFEEEFAAFCGAEHAIAVANGTAALHAAFVGLEIGEGDRVLTTPFSFVASANAIRLVGAEPVFADIEPATYTLDPAAVRETLEEEAVDAIMPVHLYGLPADMDALSTIAEEYGVALVEDAAQAHGASVGGEAVGTIGDVGCFSFYPTKNMTTGEGGMVVTDDDAIVSRVRQYIDHGRIGAYLHETVGHNFRMTSIAAAIGRVQLSELGPWNERRRENATRYDEALRDTPLVTPHEPAGRRHVYHQYTIRTDDRAGIVAALDEHDIGYGIYYERPIHDQPAYAAYEGDYPAADAAGEEVLSIPVHPGVDDDDIDRVSEVITTHAA